MDRAPSQQRVVVRSATAEDLPAIELLCRDVYMEVYGHHFSSSELRQTRMDEVFCQSALRTALHECSLFLVAELDGEIFATVRLEDTPSEKVPPCVWEARNGDATGRANRPAEISRFYVASRHRSNGHGLELLERVAALAQSLGFDALWLHVWQENASAIRFYERKAGFHAAGVAVLSLPGADFVDTIMLRHLCD